VIKPPQYSCDGFFMDEKHTISNRRRYPEVDLALGQDDKRAYYMFSISLALMTRRFFLFFILLLCWQMQARANFVFDNNCIDAYKAILSLRINDARVLIQKEKQQEPGNGIVVLLENYIDYFSLLASESKQDYDRLGDNRSKRISALEENDSNSPFYLYSQAQVYLQWAFLKAKFGDFVSSAFDAKKARGLLNDNEEKYPNFLPDEICLAHINVIFGSIPPNGITRFMGMTGNVQAGVKKLEDINGELPKSKFNFLNNEVVFYICTTDINGLHNLKDYPKLLSYLSQLDTGSLLKSYMQGYIASKTAHNDDVISFLEAAPKSTDYIKVPQIDYMLGCAQLNRVTNAMPDALFSFIKYTKGANYIKDAYLKIAYCYFLQGDAAKYASYIQMVKTHGNTTDEKDQQALWEANDARPDADLLKTRFYFDGGYYSKALAQLSGKNENSFPLLRDKIIYHYYLGRIFDKTDRFNDAIESYQKAINLGRETKYYFSANAAVSMGELFEARKDFKKAAAYYNQALDMKGHQYQTDIDNDAKTGLKRIGQD
jgi:tetratricopeptide (TPR) repeat protein